MPNEYRYSLTYIQQLSNLICLFKQQDSGLTSKENFSWVCSPMIHPSSAKYLGVIVTYMSKQSTSGGKVNCHCPTRWPNYKQIIPPIWEYGCQIWGLASYSKIRRMQAAQNRIARTIIGCEWFIRNTILQRDLKLATVSETINTYALKSLSR